MERIKQLEQMQVQQKVEYSAKLTAMEEQMGAKGRAQKEESESQGVQI